MQTYPIRVPRKSYRGTNERLRLKCTEKNMLAERIENYINSKIENRSDEIQQFLYGYIAVDLDVAEEAVCDLLFGIGGHNGITIRKNPYKEVL